MSIFLLFISNLYEYETFSFLRRVTFKFIFCLCYLTNCINFLMFEIWSCWSIFQSATYVPKKYLYSVGCVNVPAMCVKLNLLVALLKFYIWILMSFLNTSIISYENFELKISYYDIIVVDNDDFFLLVLLISAHYVLGYVVVCNYFNIIIPFLRIIPLIV